MSNPDTRRSLDSGDNPMHGRRSFKAGRESDKTRSNENNTPAAFRVRSISRGASLVTS